MISGPTGGSTDDQLISLNEAVAMAARARVAQPKAIRGWGFGRSALDAVLGQAGCAGIRIYRGLTLEGDEQMIIVGIDKAGNDMVTGLIAERSWPCPPICGAVSVLNS